MLSRISRPLFVVGGFTRSKYTASSRLGPVGSLGGCIQSEAGRLIHQAGHPDQDRRLRLSRLWAPSGGIATSTSEDAHSKLVRAGFLRQAHSGIFHMLPFGHRVQIKIERLIDKHMQSLGASRLDLSSISSERLWRKSGRLMKKNPELFQFKDRKGAGYLLSPTHEEEITALVGSSVKSFRELPVRLYQISRKYRDELRPRHGLLRSREFVMKDLYTFDDSKTLALATYEEVRAAYVNLFKELKIPYIVAEADSGDMGGTLSHEFHFLTSHGEDHVISCGNCNYVANEELAETPISTKSDSRPGVEWTFIPSEQAEYTGNIPRHEAFAVWRGISKDRSTLANVWYPLTCRSSSHKSSAVTLPEINMHAVKAIFPDLDSSVEDVTTLWAQNLRPTLPTTDNRPTCMLEIKNFIDYRLPASVVDAILSNDPGLPVQPGSSEQSPGKAVTSVVYKDAWNSKPLNLLRIRDGDTCPRCKEEQLQVQMAVELGHTFFLGTRYSEPFKARFTISPGLSEEGSLPNSSARSSSQSLMQMGCHGIGVSRMIGAVAEALMDEKGLNWPRVIAPYEIVIVPSQGNETDALSVYDKLTRPSSDNTLDVVLDDRAYPFAWKMRDADLIGYPVIVVVGKGWKSDGSCEVQCRRLGTLENVAFGRLNDFVRGLLDEL